MELGGTGVDKLKDWGDDLGWVWPKMWFLDQGRSFLLSLHWFYMQKRRKGHLANEIAWKWIEMVICCFGKITLRAGQKSVRATIMHFSTTENFRKWKQVSWPTRWLPTLTFLSWHILLQGWTFCFFFFFCRRAGTALLLVIMQRINQRLETRSF